MFAICNRDRRFISLICKEHNSLKKMDGCKALYGGIFPLNSATDFVSLMHVLSLPGKP